MELTLKGKIKKLGSTYGIINSNDYNEEHFFIKSDVDKTDRIKIKLGDLVTFELKKNKARGSNAYKIKLFSFEESFKDLEENNITKVSGDSSLLKKILNNEKPHISVNAFQMFMTEGFYILNEDNKDLTDLIKLVVRDNIITDVEKIFLKEKTNELNLATDLVKKVNDYMFSNNPYFDNILEMIFKDGVIKENELAFLLEKSKENSFSSSFINNRFWQYSFALHLNELLEFKNIKKIIKLWYLSKNTEFDVALKKDWIIMKLNILKSTKIEENIDRALDHFEKEIFPFLKNKYNISIAEVEQIYEHVILDIDGEPLEKLLDIEKKIEKTHEKEFIGNSLGLRQSAVINAVKDINDCKIGKVCFPIDIKTFKNIVCGYYASKYFILNDLKPQNLASVVTLFNGGLISLIDGVDEKTVFDQLKKNGHFAAANSYSKTHKNSTFNNDVFSFTLSKEVDKLTFNDKSINETQILKKEKEFIFTENKLYNKKDIYNFFDVPKEQQKGKWHNGYCEHNGDWFIFTNIGQTGHGFYENDDFDYNNSLDQFGDLNWEAINNSKLSWDSIQKLKSSSPYIFLRKPETEKNYWEYLGIGSCLYTLDTTPVKFKWKILLEKTPIKEIKTLNKISNSKNKKTLKQWNKSIVPVKYKARIIDLINNNEIFEASQEYLNLAYENDNKNPSKVMKEFERLIESLDK